MNPLITTNPVNKEFDVTTANPSQLNPKVDVHVTVVPSKNPDIAPTIIIDSVPTDNDLTVTPAFLNFPTDEEVVIKPNTVVLLEHTNDISDQNNSTTSPATPFRPSQQRLQLMDELKYLLKATNSLSAPEAPVLASQEADSAIKRRSTRLEEDLINDPERLLYEGLTLHEAKSLGAADRRSNAARFRSSSNTLEMPERSRTGSMQPTTNMRPSVPPSTIVIAEPEHRSFLDHLSGLIWAFLAAYAFSIILFLTKTFGIDLIFGFFLQMVVQTIAFAVYAFYKGYNLLGPRGHRLAMIARALLIGIGVLTSFLAYYYISLPELSTIRQTQVVLTIILSIFFLRERVTILRIIACIMTIIAIVILIRPTLLGTSSSMISNRTNETTSWVPYSSTASYLVGIGFALCTAILYSIASVMNKIYFSAQHLHNSVLCFWSALSALIISIILVCVSHLLIKDARLFPRDWRLFVGIALGLASIFVFIANQKAIKRERSSIVTIIYVTDIILALILQNLFTHIRSDLVVILGCVLVLASVLIICIEVLVMENRQNTLAIKVARAATGSEEENNDSHNPSSLKTSPKRLSL